MAGLLLRPWPLCQWHLVAVHLHPRLGPGARRRRAGCDGSAGGDHGRLSGCTGLRRATLAAAWLLAGPAAVGTRGVGAAGMVARLVPHRLSLAVARVFSDRYLAGGARAVRRRAAHEFCAAHWSRRAAVAGGGTRSTSRPGARGAGSAVDLWSCAA